MITLLYLLSQIISDQILSEIEMVKLPLFITILNS